MDDLTVFSQQNIVDVVEDELVDSAERYTPVKAPKAVLLAGQPGGWENGAGFRNEPFAGA